MKVTTRVSRPVREKSGSWTTVIDEIEEEVPPLGREELMCNFCGFADYPKCRDEWCKAWKPQTLNNE